MSKLVSALFLFCFAFSQNQAQTLKTPAPSPYSSVKQDFGLSSIELSYSRPGKKGRSIFGDLVPYGQVWRTGANQATTINFGEEVNFGGVKVPAGKYGLLSIPGQSEWTIILTRQLDVTSPAAYKQDQDVARVTAAVQHLPFSVESFTMMIGDITANECSLGLLWDDVYVGVPISVDIDGKIMAQIDEAMKSDKPPYFTAAMYYLDHNRDLTKALGWFNKAAEQSPNAYWILHQKANCLARLGKKAEAIETAKQSIEKAKAAQNSDYVKLNEDLIRKLQE